MIEIKILAETWQAARDLMEEYLVPLTGSPEASADAQRPTLPEGSPDPAMPPGTPERSEAPVTPITPLSTSTLPWDPRIHGRDKKLNQNGSFRFKRNVDPALKESVIAELLLAQMPPPLQSSPDPATEPTTPPQGNPGPVMPPTPPTGDAYAALAACYGPGNTLLEPIRANLPIILGTLGFTDLGQILIHVRSVPAFNRLIQGYTNAS